nr:uncharacterized protein LOC129381700 [Dermacentor andersoni]
MAESVTMGPKPQVCREMPAALLALPETVTITADSRPQNHHHEAAGRKPGRGGRLGVKVFADLTVKSSSAALRPNASSRNSTAPDSVIFFFFDVVHDRKRRTEETSCDSRAPMQNHPNCI